MLVCRLCEGNQWKEVEDPRNGSSGISDGIKS